MKTLGLTSPGQLAVMAAMAGKPVLADCKLVVEVWYPAVGDGSLRSGYMTLGHDGRTEVRLSGRAARDAASVVGDFPLVILSHGSPGNCTLLSHFGENLAFKGYVVASIDHFESTCDDPVYLGGQAFGSTLLNRPLDTRFLMDALAATRVAIVGYAMGGYGARVAGGAFVAEAALAMEGGGPWLAQHRTAVADPRLKAIVPIGPWGRQIGVWEAAGMAVPALIIAGSLDDIPGYETGYGRSLTRRWGWTGFC